MSEKDIKAFGMFIDDLTPLLTDILTYLNQCATVRMLLTKENTVLDITDDIISVQIINHSFGDRLPMIRDFINISEYRYAYSKLNITPTFDEILEKLRISIL